MRLLGRFLQWLFRRQRVDSATTQTKVNLGCGMEVAPGWLNIDGSFNALVACLPSWLIALAYHFSGARNFYPKAKYCQILSNNDFVYHNLAYGIPLPNDSVTFCYSSHFLEHLDRLTAQSLVNEIGRVLRPEGVVRIAVPDLEYAWQMYRDGRKEQMLSDFFFIDHLGDFSKHRWAYDFEMLSKVLANAGLTNISKRSCGEGSVSDLDVLDNRAEYTLFVEAMKPPAITRP